MEEESYFLHINSDRLLRNLKNFNKSKKENRERKGYSDNKIDTELLKDVPQIFIDPFTIPLSELLIYKWTSRRSTSPFSHFYESLRSLHCN